MIFICDSGNQIVLLKLGIFFRLGFVWFLLNYQTFLHLIDFWSSNILELLLVVTDIILVIKLFKKWLII
jgi:hypothetical protein